MQAIAPRDDEGELAQVLLFDRCDHLSPDDVVAWLAERAGTEPAGIAGVHANVDQAQFTRALGAIHDYTIAATETSVATQLTVAVRNKAVEAFQEIMRMQA